MTLAYARTIHKFQGLSAGPVDKGKIPNPFRYIICDPDEKKYEANALGLLYTAVSRATTLGDEDGLNSAIYFTGEHFTSSRIRRLPYKKDSNDKYEPAKARDRWTNLLRIKSAETHKTIKAITTEQRLQMREWSDNFRVDKDTLQTTINNYVQQLTHRTSQNMAY